MTQAVDMSQLHYPSMGTGLPYDDPRQEEGELMWPERFDEAAVAKLEAGLDPRLLHHKTRARKEPAGQRWSTISSAKRIGLLHRSYSSEGAGVDSFLAAAGGLLVSLLITSWQVLTWAYKWTEEVPYTLCSFEVGSFTGTSSAHLHTH